MCRVRSWFSIFLYNFKILTIDALMFTSIPYILVQLKSNLLLISENDILKTEASHWNFSKKDFACGHLLPCSKWFCIYIALFLVLMTTQSSLQYSFTFTQSHTHSCSASISSTLLFYEAQFRVQHLAQGHFGMQIGKTGDRTADLQVPTLPLSHSRSKSSLMYRQLKSFHCVFRWRVWTCRRVSSSLSGG